jgi:hypothetical protein
MHRPLYRQSQRNDIDMKGPNTRGSKMMAFRAGEKLHAQVFAAARANGLTATDFIKAVLTEASFAVLYACKEILPVRQRYNTNPKLPQRETLATQTDLRQLADLNPARAQPRQPAAGFRERHGMEVWHGWNAGAATERVMRNGR